MANHPRSFSAGSSGDMFVFSASLLLSPLPAYHRASQNEPALCPPFGATAVQILEDCESYLELDGEVHRLLGWTPGREVVLLLNDGRPCRIGMYEKNGRGFLGAGWPVIADSYALNPGDYARFTSAWPGVYYARFHGSDGAELHSSAGWHSVTMATFGVVASGAAGSEKLFISPGVEERDIPQGYIERMRYVECHGRIHTQDEPQHDKARSSACVRSMHQYFSRAYSWDYVPRAQTEVVILMEGKGRAWRPEAR